MKLDVGKVVDNMTRGSCIPIDSVKSSDDYYSLVHSIETGACNDSNKTNLATRLVKVMKCQVGNIRKRGRGVIWITIKIEKNIVISYITQEISNTNKENKKISKQIKRKKNLT